MRFRPCIDLHGGRVKQIVGSTLSDDDQALKTNFDSAQPPEFYSNMYFKDGLEGGHVIKLGPGNDEAARRALAAHPDFLQVGGGINEENAREWIQAGAQKVIVTSWLFDDNGNFLQDRLERLAARVTPERLVVDLSCRWVDGKYKVAINRWQKIIDMEVTSQVLGSLAGCCREFLIHAVDVEGKQSGIEMTLVKRLARAAQEHDVSITYAGGISTMEDIRLINEMGNGCIDFTVGSALDIFGGKLAYRQIVEMTKTLH